MNSYQLEMCDLRIGFRTEAPAERVEQARAYVDTLYKEFKASGSLLGSERILAILLIGIADEMLQLRGERESVDSRITELLAGLTEQESDPADASD